MAVAADTVVLRGRPEALEAPLPGLTWGEATTAPEARIEVAGGEAPVTALVTLPGSTMLVGVRIVLPDDTPPGTYRGTLRVAGREYGLTAEVAGRAGLALLPAKVEVDAAAGESAEVALTAVNTGNVDVEVPERQRVGVFAAEGVERAIGRAFVGKAQRGLDRFDTLGSALADEHGGALILHTAEGAGTLTPGEMRELRLEARVPAGVSAGTTYFGYWHLATARVEITVNVHDAPEVPA